MPINVEQDAVDRIWTLLEEREGFTSEVLEGNRIKTEEINWMQRDSSRSAPADFPTVRVYVTNNATNKPTLLLSNEGADFPIEGRLDIEIRTIFDRSHDAVTMPLEAEIDAALLGGGIDLGLPWVRWIMTNKTRRTESTRETRNVLRTVSRQRVSMETSIMSSEFE